MKYIVVSLTVMFRYKMLIVNKKIDVYRLVHINRERADFVCTSTGFLLALVVNVIVCFYSERINVFVANVSLKERCMCVCVCV